MSDSLTDGTTDFDKPETTANSDNNEKESLSTNENKTGEQSEKEQIATEFEDNGQEDAGTETALSSENSEKEILSTNENKITEQPEKERTPPQTEEKTSQDVANTDVKRKEEENIHGNTRDENETVQVIDNMESVTEEITVKLTEKETTPDISRVETIDNTEKETTPDISKVERISPQTIDNTEKETTPDISKVERITPQTIDNTEDVTGNNEEELGKSQHVESATGKILVKITEGEIIPNEYEHVTPQHVDKVESVTDNKVTNITEDETILDNPKNAIKTSQNIDNIESVAEKLNVKTSNEDTTTADNIKDEKRTPQNIDTAESVTEKTDAKTKEEETIQEKVLPPTTENKDIFVEKVRLESNKAEEEEQDTAKISQSIKNKEESSPPKQSSEPGTPSITAKDETSVEKQSAKTPESSSTAPSKDEHADHVTYTEDGSAIYTDPQTKYQYKWCTKSNNWTPIVEQTASSASSSNPYENEHYKWCQETQKWIPKQAQVTETEHYKWDAEKQQWIPKKNDADKTQTTDNVYGIDEDGQRIYTDKDGTVFFWDVEKSAWFPKLDDDFMARYQMSYGFIDNTSAAENEKKKLEQEEAELKEKELQKMTEEAKSNDEASQGAGGAAKRKATQEPPKWFEIDPDRNTKVYVSNLPLDITLDEFTEVMGKCGMIMRDPLTQKFKLKLYTEADGQIKGDGLCDYIKVESVDLALKILDEYELRGHKIRVQQAQFQMRGEYNPALKPKRKKKDKEKLAKIKEKLFDWRPEKMRGERSKHEKTVIIKNLFHPELFEKEVQLILDYQNDLKEECNKCGTVRKVVIYDRHAEGVAQINMASPEEADLVIQMMQGRFFGKRQLTAEHWDGKTKYKIEETEEEVKKRLNKWDKYLETDAQKSEVKRVDQEKADSDDCEKGTTDEVCEQSEEPVVADIAT